MLPLPLLLLALLYRCCIYKTMLSKCIPTKLNTCALPLAWKWNWYFCASINFHNLIYAEFNWQMPHALCACFVWFICFIIWFFSLCLSLLLYKRTKRSEFTRSILPRNLVKMLSEKNHTQKKRGKKERTLSRVLYDNRNIFKLIVLNCYLTLIVHPFNVKVHDLIVKFSSLFFRYHITAPNRT